MNKILQRCGINWINTYFELNNCILLKLERKDKSESYNCYIDKEDFKLVSKYKWYVCNKRKYKNNLKDVYSIVTSIKINNKTTNYDIYQLILGTKGNKNVVVDHIDNDRFNNRKSNLRITTCRVNSINQFHKGYNYDKNTGKFLVRIRIVTKNGIKKDVNIGRYDCEEEAEIMYLKACILLGYDKISKSVVERLNKIGLKELYEDDFNNKYLLKLKFMIEDKEIPKELDGRIKK